MLSLSKIDFRVVGFVYVCGRLSVSVPNQVRGGKS